MRRRTTMDRHDCNSNNIRLSELESATVTADLELSLIGPKSRTSTPIHLAESGRPIRKGQFHRLKIVCASSIITKTTRYNSQKTDVEEWPVGWLSA